MVAPRLFRVLLGDSTKRDEIEVVAASFLGLDLQAVLHPNGEGGEEEEEAKRAKEGEATPIEAPALLTIEEANPITEEVLSTFEDAEVTAKTPSLIGIEVVVLFEGGISTGGHTEVPSSSRA